MSTIRVHTAQNVTLEYEIASVGDRIVAAILDNIILGAWIFACVLIFFQIYDNSNQPGPVATVILVLLAGIPYVFYNLICEVFFNGQSIGKKARDIRVMRLDGTAPRLADYLMRWLLRVVDTVLFSGLVAVITIVANGRGQRLGDMAAGTTVVSVKPRPPHAAPSPETAAALASYQVVFPQAARLADHDVATIRQILQHAARHNNEQIFREVALKIKELTDIHTDLPDVPFLQTVLRDHAYLAAQ